MRGQNFYLSVVPKLGAKCWCIEIHWTKRSPIDTVINYPWDSPKRNDSLCRVALNSYWWKLKSFWRWWQNVAMEFSTSIINNDRNPATLVPKLTTVGISCENYVGINILVYCYMHVFTFMPRTEKFRLYTKVVPKLKFRWNMILDSNRRLHATLHVR